MTCNKYARLVPCMACIILLIDLMSFCLVFSFIGEESVVPGEKCVLTDNATWIIDPIDGTTNFVHR